MVVDLTLAERLARAVLLFHNAPDWGPAQRNLWFGLTGTEDATSRVLCDLAREVRADEERRNSG